MEPQNKTKKIILIVVAVFFLLLTGVAAYLMLGQKQTSQPAATVVTTPSSTPAPDPTANWLTYSNPSLGFSFLYPIELAYPYDQLGDLISKKSTQGILLLQNFDGSKPPPAENTLQVIFDITRSQTLTLDQYVKNLTASGSATVKTTVTGYPAYMFTTIEKGEQITNIAFKYADLLYNTSINLSTKEGVELLKLILSTLKFTTVSTTTASSASPSASQASPAATIRP